MVKKKKPNKTDIGAAYARLVHANRTGEPPTKVRKDGSIATKPVVPSKQTEAEVMRGCIRWLKRHRFGVKRMNVGSGVLHGTTYRTYGIPGAGDLLVVKDGKYIEVEVKAGKGGRLSRRQQKHRGWVESHGGKYLIVHSITELENFLLDF